MDAAEPASSAEPETTKFTLEGWVCDPANPFLHKICRSVIAQGGDWPISLVLAVGDEQDESTPSIEVPPAVLRWLLTGEL